MTAWEH